MGAKLREGQQQDGEVSLRGRDFDDFFDGTEKPVYVLTNEKRGIKHDDGDGERTVTPGEEYNAVAAATDERVLLVVGGNADGESRNRRVSLPYTEIRSVEANHGMLKNRLTVTARTSDRYHFWVGGRTDIDDVVAYIERAISHWVALGRRLEKAREHLSAVESGIGEGDRGQTDMVFSRIDELLEEARAVARQFADGEGTMHRRIAQVETQRSLTEKRALRARAERLVDEAEAARAEDELATAVEAYEQALDAYNRIMEMNDGFDSVEVEAVESEAEGVRRAIASLRIQPTVRATDTSQAAVEADADDVDTWESALEECHEALVLVHRHGNTFQGDPEVLRFQVEWAAGNLIEAHRIRAADAEKRGDERRHDDPEAARETCERARSHLEDALAVAREFRSGDPAAIEADLNRMNEKLGATATEDEA